MNKIFVTSVILGMTSTGFAADILVPGNQATIIDAVAAASAGDRIVLTQDTTPYAVNAIQIPVSLTIEAGTGLSPVVQVENGAARAFRVSAGVDVTFRGFTLDGSLNVPGIDGASNGIVFSGTNTIVIDDMVIADINGRSIDGRSLSGPLNLTITDTLFDGSDNRTIQIGDVVGSSTIVVTDSRFTGSADDALAIRNNGTYTATIERNTFFNDGDADSDVMQLGGNAGSTFLIRDNVVYNWTDDAIQIEANAAVAFTITRNTFYNVGTGINLDASGAFTGSVNATQNLFVGWNQSLLAPKGFALSANSNDGAWTVTNNAFIDGGNSQFSVGTSITIDGSNVTGDNEGAVFLSTNPVDSNFLFLAPGSPARNVAGSGFDAGAQQLSSVEEWMSY